MLCREACGDRSELMTSSGIPSSARSRADSLAQAACPSPTDIREQAAAAEQAAFARRLYAPVAHLLPMVEHRLQGELQTRYELIAPVLRHGVQLGGKRLRPALLLLAGMTADPDAISEEHITLGVVLEMVHTATLIHDDVLDGAQTRRHVRTINTVWGDHASILLGDYLFSQAFRLSATLGSTEPCRWIGEASRRVCEGELRQVLSRNAIDLDESSYLEMIAGKTAELCSVACRLGALSAGSSQQAAGRLATYGQSLGIAFQIADDYLDIWGSDTAVGKTLGTDLAQGKWTLPVLRLLQTASPAEAKQIRTILCGPPEDRLEALLPLLERSDAQQYTQQVAEFHRDQACHAIASLPHSPARRALMDIATFSIMRTF
jgi:octaprenyl-diphosphate synthase